MGEKKGVEIDKSSYYETVLKVMKMQACQMATFKSCGIIIFSVFFQYH
jgi:hypothetical protein